MSTSCIEPKGNTLSLENPRKWGCQLNSRCQLWPDGPFCWPQLLELPRGRHGGASIPPDLSQRMLWMYRAEAVWTPFVLPLPLLT